MAYRQFTTPARAGGSTRTPAALYSRPYPVLEQDEAAPGSIEDWEVTAPVRPDTAHVRAPRFLDALGETVVGLLIVAGGVLAYGHLPVA